MPDQAHGMVGDVPLTWEDADARYRQECAIARRSWLAQADVLERRAGELESLGPGFVRVWVAPVLGLLALVLVPLAGVVLAGLTRPVDAVGWGRVVLTVVLLVATGVWVSSLPVSEQEHDLPVVAGLVAVVVGAALVLSGVAWGSGRDVVGGAVLVAGLAVGLVTLPAFAAAAVRAAVAGGMRSRARSLREDADRLAPVEARDRALGVEPTRDR